MSTSRMVVCSSLRSARISARRTWWACSSVHAAVRGLITTMAVSPRHEFQDADGERADRSQQYCGYRPVHARVQGSGFREKGDCGLRVADWSCGFQSAIRNPQSAIAHHGPGAAGITGAVVRVSLLPFATPPVMVASVRMAE